MRRDHPPIPKHALSDFLSSTARRRKRQKKAAWGVLLAVMLYAVSSLQSSEAVGAYRSGESYGPSPKARDYLPQCRRAALDTINGGGKIESESFVRRPETEYFRFIVRNGSREVMVLCDGHAGVISRQIDLWSKL